MSKAGEQGEQQIMAETLGGIKAFHTVKFMSCNQNAMTAQGNGITLKL